MFKERSCITIYYYYKINIKLKITKPDIDKIIRAVMDSMTLSGVIKDDANCYLIMSRKMYCNPDEQPGVFGIIADTQKCDNI